MIVLPAIDLLDGKVVRLRQGRLDEVTVYNESPADQARQWAEGGADWIHVVDLDGAVRGVPVNLDKIAEIVKAVPDVNVEVGGGLRTMESLQALYDVGVRRTVLGTALITKPDFVAEACTSFPGIVAGIDAREGKVAIEGWRRGTERGVLELVQELEILGVGRLIYTDISVDGMQTGINYGVYCALAGQIDIPVIASGGVASVNCIRDLAMPGCGVEGVIVGRALYEGRFSLPEAIEAARGAAA